jgi:hypothetical protein
MLCWKVIIHMYIHYVDKFLTLLGVDAAGIYSFHLNILKLI